MCINSTDINKRNNHFSSYLSSLNIELPQHITLKIRSCGGFVCHCILCVILKELSPYLRGGFFKYISCLLSRRHKCFMLQFSLFHLYFLSKFVSTQPPNQETIENRQSRDTHNFGHKTQNEDKKNTQLRKLEKK